ncbi:hypothetical protein NQ317_011195 [Molorchus minor]|uniref:Anoctamin n=1 Tax=Molorchus minor TaxID=1323400 RepID=A0ABQ9JS49_9CUCU|nr:hypothetical protein NQ317_011195 [Molorchus minor]
MSTLSWPTMRKEKRRCGKKERSGFRFDVDAPDFFNTSVRTTVISYILERERFGDEDQDKGIKRLIAEGVYKAAYPLHDNRSQARAWIRGEGLEPQAPTIRWAAYRPPGPFLLQNVRWALGPILGDINDDGSRRKLLLDEWASVSKCIKFQPLDEIKDYFGVKFALYFSWLGFYTHMLIPAAIVGLLCLIYGAVTLRSDTLSRDICQKNITMCPRCDKNCDYWNLNQSCMYSKIQHFIDNPATIFFAVFMSFWSTLYLELWKRYSAEIAHRWGLTGFDLQAEPPRPEYLMRLATAKKKKLNVVTLLQEPVVPFWRVKLPSIILIMGVVVYRMSYVASDLFYQDKTSYRIYFVPVTAAFINLVCIVILNLLYDRLAEWLTEMELQRTQTEYDDSLALKIYMFQFVNYYSSIFYVAFFKGKFVGYPSKYNKVFGLRQEECNPGGCLMELTIQLTIIMIGNQALNTIMEMVVPLLNKMYQTFKITTGLEKAEKEEDVLITCNQWTEDYKLSEFGSRSLFTEYLEMVCRYAEYRNPHDYPDPALKYKRPLIYWHILAARLAFIVVYQNLVGFVMTVVEWTIPDVSRKLNDRIKREAYRTNETMIKYENDRAKERQRVARKRDSLISGMTVYHDANGDLPNEGITSNRSTMYYEPGDT